MKESIRGNNSFAIWITLSDHLSGLCQSQVFMQLFCCSNEVLFWNVPLILIIKITEYSVNIIISISFARFLGHEFDELPEGYLTTIINVKYWHCNINERSSRLVSTVFPNCSSQIQRCQHAIMVIIQKIKNMFKNLNIMLWTLSNDVFFWIELY